MYSFYVGFLFIGHWIWKEVEHFPTNLPIYEIFEKKIALNKNVKVIQMKC